jgi:hypothetical protein
VVDLRRKYFRSGPFLLVLALIVGGVSAQATGILNTPSGGYLVCVNPTTKVVTHPGTSTCPKGSKKLVLGAHGVAGTKSKSGNTLWTGITDPTSAIGEPGDMFINSVTRTLFGPKNVTSSWPAGVSMIGPTGATGPQGPGGAGPAGPAGPAGSAGAPAAPAFTLSSSAETRTVNTSATGFNIQSTGGAITIFVISATPPGMSFNNSTGTLSGTPTTIASATDYTVTASNATGSTSRTFTLTVTAPVYTVGSTGPGGGKVFYVALTPFACGPTLAGTCSYLEAAPTTGASNWTDAEYAWSGNTNTSIGAEDVRGTAVGKGYANTLAIVNQEPGGDTSGRAGTIARAYRGPNNLSDWYLPSQGELNQMCKWQRGQAWTSDATLCNNDGANNSGSGAAGFTAGSYWSSTEQDVNNARFQQFSDRFGTAGAQNNILKTQTMNVRPIRAF